MQFELLKRDIIELVDGVLGRSEAPGEHLFGLPYRTVIALIFSCGFLCGCVLVQMVGVGWCPVIAHQATGQADVVFTLSRIGFIVVFIGAAIIAAIAFLGNFAETWQKLGVLAIAAGFLFWGFWIIAIHRIELHPDRFVVRGPIIPIAISYTLTDGNSIVSRFQTRKTQNRFRGTTHYNTYSIHYIRTDGSETVLHNGNWGPNTWAQAAVQIIREDIGPAGLWQ